MKDLLRRLSMDRRKFLLGSAAVAAFATSGQTASASRIETLRPVIPPKLRMWNANTDEKIYSVFWKDGAYDEQELRRLDWFMRDWREAEIKPCSRDLLWGLAAIREAAMRDGHTGEIRFLSGYRSRKTNDHLRAIGRGAARNSLHIKAKAVDFSVLGVPVKSISQYAQWLDIGGVGYYPGSFVHMDTGSRRSWTG